MDEQAVRRDERQRIVNWLRKVNQVHISMLDDPRYENQHEKLRIRSQEMNYIINMIWSFDNEKYNKREP